MAARPATLPGVAGGDDVTNEEINAAVATRIMGWHKHLIDGFWEERPGSGAVVSSWNPAGDWGYAMMAAEKWCRAGARRKALLCLRPGTDDGLYLQARVSDEAHMAGNVPVPDAIADRTENFASGPRALCEALLQAAGVDTETEKQ